MAKFESLSYIDKALGLGDFTTVNGERVTGIYEANELQHLNFDNYTSLVFLMKNGQVSRDTTEHPFIATADMITEVFPLKLIIYTQGAESVNCESFSQSLAQDLKKQIDGLKRDIADAVNADLVDARIISTELNKQAVWETLFSTDPQLKDTDILISADLEISVKGIETCFANELCAPGQFVFDYAAHSFCSLVSNCTNIGKAPIIFYTTADKSTYTADDVAGIARITELSDIVSVQMATTMLDPSFWGFENGEFEIKNATIYGGEYIVIFIK